MWEIPSLGLGRVGNQVETYGKGCFIILLLSNLLQVLIPLIKWLFHFTYRIDRIVMKRT
jgi:hypothetical protein